MFSFNVLLLSCFIYSTLASTGDQSPIYRKCLQRCKSLNCEKDGIKIKNPLMVQSTSCRFFGWTCMDECKYECMWTTVKEFERQGFKLPKFHGKWPFERMLCMQEPAAAFASVLNMAAHLHMNKRLLAQFPVHEMPVVAGWHLFTVVCVHAWSWSAVFHARDTPFTEFMDYAGALSMVVALCFAAVSRVLHTLPRVRVCVAAAVLLVFVRHVRYLYAGRVNYDYNMLVNVVLGALGSFTWLAWAVARYAAGRRYMWRLVLFTALAAAATALELLDFPPWRAVWDAHALWHLSTAPLPYLFYRFVMDDLTYLKDLQYCRRLGEKLA